MDWQLDVGVAEATALKLSEALVAARKREEEARRSARTRGAKAHQRNGWREDEEKLSPAPSCVNLFKTGSSGRRKLSSRQSSISERNGTK